MRTEMNSERRSPLGVGRREGHRPKLRIDVGERTYISSLESKKQPPRKLSLKGKKGKRGRHNGQQNRQSNLGEK